MKSDVGCLFYGAALLYAGIDFVFFVYTGFLGIFYSLVIGLLTVWVLSRGWRTWWKLAALAVLLIAYSEPPIAISSLADSWAARVRFHEGDDLSGFFQAFGLMSGLFVSRSVVFVLLTGIFSGVVHWLAQRTAKTA